MTQENVLNTLTEIYVILSGKAFAMTASRRFLYEEVNLPQYKKKSARMDLNGWI